MIFCSLPAANRFLGKRNTWLVLNLWYPTNMSHLNLQPIDEERNCTVRQKLDTKDEKICNGLSCSRVYNEHVPRKARQNYLSVLIAWWRLLELHAGSCSVCWWMVQHWLVLILACMSHTQVQDVTEIKIICSKLFKSLLDWLVKTISCMGCPP